MGTLKPVSAKDLSTIKAALEGRFISCLRLTRPGSIITKDFDPNRLWIVTDDEGVVREVKLG
jgi:hypothetical protein